MKTFRAFSQVEMLVLSVICGVLVMMLIASQPNQLAKAMASPVYARITEMKTELSEFASYRLRMPKDYEIYFEEKIHMEGVSTELKTYMADDNIYVISTELNIDGRKETVLFIGQFHMDKKYVGWQCRAIAQHDGGELVAAHMAPSSCAMSESVEDFYVFNNGQ